MFNAIDDWQYFDGGDVNFFSGSGSSETIIHQTPTLNIHNPYSNVSIWWSFTCQTVSGSGATACAANCRRGTTTSGKLFSGQFNPTFGTLPYEIQFGCYWTDRMWLGNTTEYVLTVTVANATGNWTVVQTGWTIICWH